MVDELAFSGRSDLLVLAGDLTMAEEVQHRKFTSLSTAILAFVDIHSFCRAVVTEVEMTVGMTIDALLLDEAPLPDDHEVLLPDDHEAHPLTDDETETPGMTEIGRTDDDPGPLWVVDEAVEAFHRMATLVLGKLIELTMPSTRTLGVKLVAMNETNKRKMSLLPCLIFQ